jgi:hypothetical protein
VLRKKTAPIEGQTTEIIEVNQNRFLTTLIFIVTVGADAALAYAMQMVGADLAAVGIGPGTREWTEGSRTQERNMI